VRREGGENAVATSTSLISRTCWTQPARRCRRRRRRCAVALIVLRCSALSPSLSLSLSLSTCPPHLNTTSPSPPAAAATHSQPHTLTPSHPPPLTHTHLNPPRNARFLCDVFAITSQAVLRIRFRPSLCVPVCPTHSRN